MKRIPTGLVAVISVLTLGALASACDVAPKAASVNGDTISVASLNADMNALAGSAAGQCLLALRSGQPASVDPGSGTVPTAFAGSVLSSDVGNLVAAQFAAAHGIHLTGTDLATAQNNYAAALDGGIASLGQQAAAAGAASPCQKADGSAFTGQALLTSLPAAVRNSEVANQAVDDKLLARGADLSNAAVLNFYAANRSLFAVDCVSDIAVATQAEADQIVAKLKAGASFASLATASSIDPQTASSGGQLGCNFTDSRVQSALQVASITVGQPVTPLQTSGGQWVIYEVTSQTVIPVTQAASVIRNDLLHATANTQRVTAELLVYAHRSSIDVNPQYGQWAGASITPPPSPPVRYLQPSYVLSTTSGSGTSGPGTSGSGTSPASAG